MSGTGLQSQLSNLLLESGILVVVRIRRVVSTEVIGGNDMAGIISAVLNSP